MVLPALGDLCLKYPQTERAERLGVHSLTLLLDPLRAALSEFRCQVVGELGVPDPGYPPTSVHQRVSLLTNWKFPACPGYSLESSCFSRAKVLVGVSDIAERQV